MSTELPNYYNIFDIDIDSDLTVIKSAYKSISLRYHPDKIQQNYPNATPKEIAQFNTMYLSIQQGWDIFSNPEKKQTYDHELKKQLLVSEEVHYTININDFDVVIDEDRPDCLGFPCQRCERNIFIQIDDDNVTAIITQCESCNLRYCVQLD